MQLTFTSLQSRGAYNCEKQTLQHFWAPLPESIGGFAPENGLVTPDLEGAAPLIPLFFSFSFSIVRVFNVCVPLSCRNDTPHEYVDPGGSATCLK